MRIINPNNEILKFIKEQVTTPINSNFNLNKRNYSLNKNLEKCARFDASLVLLIIECENKFDVYINDTDAWKIKTPLDLYEAIQKKMKKK